MKILLYIAIPAVFILFAFGRKKETAEGDKEGNDVFGTNLGNDQTSQAAMQQIKSAFLEAQKDFPKATVQLAERVYRWETGHFKRGFWESFSPGMNAFSEVYPFGWNKLMKFWEKNPQFKPVGTTSKLRLVDSGTGKPLVVFPSFKAGLYTLCYYLVMVKNQPGKWHSNDINAQLAYDKAINSVVNRFVI